VAEARSKDVRVRDVLRMRGHRHDRGESAQDGRSGPRAGEQLRESLARCFLSQEAKDSAPARGEAPIGMPWRCSYVKTLTETGTASSARTDAAGAGQLQGQIYAAYAPAASTRSRNSSGPGGGAFRAEPGFAAEERPRPAGRLGLRWGPAVGPGVARFPRWSTGRNVIEGVCAHGFHPEFWTH